MNLTARDADVPPKRPEEISAWADRLRRLAGLENAEKIDVTKLLLWICGIELPGKGQLTINIFDAGENDFAARVTYNPLILHADRELWAHATLGDPHSNYILAHEIGHIVLHDENARAYSIDPVEYKLFGSEYSSAEWQADQFAGFLLVPDAILLHYLREDDLAQGCNVISRLAAKRLSERKGALKRFGVRYLGDDCPDCHNFTLVRNGLMIDCETCGKRMGCR